MSKTTATIIILFYCLLVNILVSCGHTNVAIARYTGYSSVCVDGVNYLQFPSGVTVQYDTEGHVVKCGR